MINGTIFTITSRTINLCFPLQIEYRYTPLNGFLSSVYVERFSDVCDVYCGCGVFSNTDGGIFCPAFITISTTINRFRSTERALNCFLFLLFIYNCLFHIFYWATAIWTSRCLVGKFFSTFRTRYKSHALYLLRMIFLFYHTQDNLQLNMKYLTAYPFAFYSFSLQLSRHLQHHPYQ